MQYINNMIDMKIKGICEILSYYLKVCPIKFSAAMKSNNSQYNGALAQSAIHGGSTISLTVPALQN